MARPSLIRDLKLFREQWADGVLLAVIAATHGCSVPVVSQTAKRLGLPSRYARPALGDVDPSLALMGGAWVPGRHGIQHWVPDS